MQAYEYSHAAFGFKGNIYGATFFMATGFHGAHVIIGTIFLTVCLIRAYRGQFTPKQHLGFEFAAWYWHFVDVVWLFLFACIYVWGAGGEPRGRRALTLTTATACSVGACRCRLPHFPLPLAREGQGEVALPDEAALEAARRDAVELDGAASRQGQQHVAVAGGAGGERLALQHSRSPSAKLKSAT